MLKVILTVGTCASGKSFWAKQEVAKDPANWVRINNDNIRSMINNSVYSHGQEKLVTETRLFMIKEALKKNKNVIVDNINANKKHWEDTCKIAESLNIDVEVFEKLFYIDLDEAIERDSKREGVEKVGEQVVRKWWKELGGKNFKYENPKKQVFTKSKINNIKQEIDDKLPWCVICDLDNTFAFIGNRSPYDASNCDLVDSLNEPLAEILINFANIGYEIIFLSGRQDKDELPTRRFIDKNINFQYKLYMRTSNDSRSDVIIKKELYEKFINHKYNVLAVFDDRLNVCRQWVRLGLLLFRVGDPDANF